MPLKTPRWIYWDNWGGHNARYTTAEELWPWAVLSSTCLFLHYAQSCSIHIWTIWFSFTGHVSLHLNSFELLVLLPGSTSIVILSQSCVELRFLLSPSSREETGLTHTFVSTSMSHSVVAWESCKLTSTGNVAQRCLQNRSACSFTWR